MRMRTSLVRVICMVLCFMFLSQPMIAFAEDDFTVLGLNSYLNSSENEFANELDGIQSAINVLQDLATCAYSVKMEDFELDEGSYVYKGSVSWDVSGNSLVKEKLGNALPLFIQKFYRGSNCNIELESFYQFGPGTVVRKRVYEVFSNPEKHLGAQEFSSAVLGEKVTLQNEYNKKENIYVGFTQVGYSPENLFSVNITENTIFSDHYGWDDVDRTLYGTGVNGAAGSGDNGTVDMIEEYISKPIGNGAWSLYLWMKQWNIDITIDGLVFGRMAPGYKGTADFTHFGLETNNPYGIVASTVFYVLRRIILSVMPVIVMILLIVNLFRNGKKRALLKEDLQNVLFVLVMLFAAPYLINLMIYIRDGILHYTHMGMSEIYAAIGMETLSVGGSVVGVLYLAFEGRKSLLNALLLLGGVGSCMFYLANYLKIALVLMACFAMLPIVLFKAVWDRKIVGEWWNIYFPNFCVPLVDLVLLQIPSAILLVYKKVSNGGGGFVLGIMLMLVIWSMIPVRDRVIRLLGFEGFGNRGGGGMVAAAMMMMRAFTSPVRNGNGGKNGVSEPGKEDKLENSRLDSAAGDVMSEAKRDMLADEGLPQGEDLSPKNDRLASETEQFLEDMREADTGGETETDTDADSYGDGVSDGYDAGSPEEPELVAVDEDAYGEMTDTVEGEMPDTVEGDIPDAGEPAAVASAPADADVGEPVTNAVTDDGAAVTSASNASAKSVINAGVGTAAGDELPDITGVKSEPASHGSSFTDRIAADSDKSFIKDREFYDGLGSDFDKGRYENLCKMDAYNREIAKNDASLRNAGFESASQCEKERAKYARQLESLDEHIEKSQSRLSMITDSSSPGYAAEKSLYDRAVQQKKDVQDRIAQLDRASEIDKENRYYKAQAAECSRREQQYAHVREVGGMEAKAYRDADAFRHASKIESAKRELATYESFDMRRYEGVLTPAERESFRRERVEQEYRQFIKKTAADVGLGAARVARDVASVGVGVGVGALALYGGPSTMASAAVVAQGITRGTVTAAADKVSDTHNWEKQRRRLKGSLEEVSADAGPAQSQPKSKSSAGSSTKPQPRVSQPRGEKSVSATLTEKATEHERVLRGGGAASVNPTRGVVRRPKGRARDDAQRSEALAQRDRLKEMAVAAEERIRSGGSKQS